MQMDKHKVRTEIYIYIILANKKTNGVNSFLILDMNMSWRVTLNSLKFRYNTSFINRLVTMTQIHRQNAKVWYKLTTRWYNRLEHRSVQSVNK